MVSANKPRSSSASSRNSYRRCGCYVPGVLTVRHSSSVSPFFPFSLEAQPSTIGRFTKDLVLFKSPHYVILRSGERSYAQLLINTSFVVYFVRDLHPWKLLAQNAFASTYEYGGVRWVVQVKHYSPRLLWHQVSA